MKIISPSVELMTEIDPLEYLRKIERIGRVCYKSEDKITDSSAEAFVRRLIKNGHEAMIEHGDSITIKFICDRGVSHEIVRHRLFSFAQESTRYCNYGKDDEITVIDPGFFGVYVPLRPRGEYNYRYALWMEAMEQSEQDYLLLIKDGATPQEARSVLPNSLKTEIVVTGNPREWRHFFKLRLSKTAHPQMREVARMAFVILNSKLPALFEDIVG